MRYIVLFILCSIQLISAELIVSPTFGKDNLELEKYYVFNSNDSIRITKLKLYISNITLLKNGKEVWKENNSYHLIDLENVATLTIIKSLPNLEYDALRIGLGIDSITNVSGALGGDLDPTKGMYWTWQSGYINFKLEGNCNLIKNRNNEFQLHIGGYQSPNSSYLEREFAISQNRNIVLKLDIKDLLEKIHIAENSQIMSPSKNAKNISIMISRMLTVQQND